jgi:fatty acid CoA ligase FadD9
VHDVFGVSLPVNSILSPAGNPQQWARAIEAELQHGGSERPTFAKLHGEGARQINAKDVDIAAFQDEDTLRQVPLGAPTDETRTVLLTGATGFLGRFLCPEWLERPAIDLVGQLVNHVMPYEDLFGPNVFGTAELVRLALRAS